MQMLGGKEKKKKAILATTITKKKVKIHEIVYGLITVTWLADWTIAQMRKCAGVPNKVAWCVYK